jgi:hypothetical protein
MATIFNPSGFRKKSRERVVPEGNGMYSFPDAYSGSFEFFKDRPIRIATDDRDKISDADLKVKVRDR